MAFEASGVERKMPKCGLNAMRHDSVGIAARAAILASLAGGLGGCVPAPYLVTVVPEIEGRVTRSGVPVPDAQILSGANPQTQCGGVANVQISNADGVFRIPAQTDWRFDFHVSEAPLITNTWELCIDHAGSKVLGFRGVNFQPRTGTVVIACDLDRQYPQPERGVQGVCRIVPVPAREGAGL